MQKKTLTVMDHRLNDNTPAIVLEALDNVPLDIWWIDEKYCVAKANKTALINARNIDVALLGVPAYELDPSFSAEIIADFFAGKEKQKKYLRTRTYADGTVECNEELLLLQETEHGRFVIRYGKDILQGEGKAYKEKGVPVNAEQTRNIHQEFIANMNHDIRTPMNAIIGYAEMLAGSDLPHREKRFAETIFRSGMTLVTILNDLMDLSKIEAGRLKLKKIPVRMPDLVGEVVDLFRDQAQLKKLDVSYFVDKDIPSIVFIDGIRLKQVIQNLLSNAIKFTRKGSICVTIEGEWDSSQADIYNLRIVVADTGIGIPEKDSAILSHILNPTGEEAVTNYNGRGFGLALCGRLVAMMGGEIVLESALGAGTTFTVTLTDVFMAETQYHLASQTTEAPEPLPAAVSRLLIVDDEELIKEVFTDYFSGSSMEVSTASTGDEALEAAVQHKPAIIFMDLHLSGSKDGKAVTMELKTNPATEHIPVIMMTGELIEDTGADPLFDGHLQKPFRFEEIEEIIAQYNLGSASGDGEVDSESSIANEEGKEQLLLISSLWSDELEVQLEKAIFTGSLSTAIKLGELIKQEGESRGLETVIDLGEELILYATEHDIIGVENLLTQLVKNEQ